MLDRADMVDKADKAGKLDILDMVIRNGQVYDGTGNPWTKLDIGISGGRIVRMGNLSEEQAKVEIDAEGLAVAPGFIDTHVHSDLLCTRPEIHHVKVLQGVTTELLGQDGISVAPVSEQTKPLWQQQLKGLNGDIGDWPWNTVEEYLSFLEQSRLAGNVMYLVPHGAVRSLVMGFANRKASSEEMRQMRELVEIGMQQGAAGVSSGLVYPPNVFSDTAEIIEICKGAAKYDGCFVVHVRNESSHFLEAVEEVIDAARQSGVRLHISHFKAIGQKNRQKFASALTLMDKAREEGIEVTFDQYPYTAGSTVLHVVLPPWMHDAGTETCIKRLADPQIRKRIEYDLEHNDDYENWVKSCGWEHIVISSVASEQNRGLEGKSVAEIARIKGKKPTDTAFDLLMEENGSVAMIVHWGQEEDVMQAMAHPLQIVGSDSIFGGKPHPRLYGTYPRILGRYVREKQVLTLSQAIRQISGAPAQLLRLKERGLLREGFWADVVVFDPATVADRSTYEDPLLEPVGIEYVIVNGQMAVERGSYMGITAGRVIRGD
ncbi:N-acyl-D-amino-acid deacylase family protein [Paenibacillus eucommiae]|uniref:N-acyl-D-amino-acid deacylase n=1 Tax=Paenibacillus eucommiae TaxID=1355755 RepID=A0ABS4J3I8_9BACL|nr:D-aminoacylase [Paenibacillus eucommiae]MBP1993781.1 N-acyl-D-amino-acid deacylase [Paenibacillus eucommiae]